MRTCILVAAALLLAGPGFAAGPPARFDAPVAVIVTTSAVEAFTEATEGIRRGLGSGVKIITVDLAANPQDLAGQLGGKDVRLIITAGTNALETAMRLGKAPVIATMVLGSDLTSGVRPPAGAVVLDLPVADVLTSLAKIFPGKTRAGIIRSPDPTAASAALLISQAKAAGISLKIVDCPRVEQLLQMFLALQGEVDFVWCPPDGTLYNGTTVKPLILASLEHQLPVVGFSASFVRAGAAAGVYPDYAETGLQAGEMAKKLLAGGIGGTIETPRKIRIAANTRVARLLGLRFTQKTGSDSFVVLE